MEYYGRKYLEEVVDKVKSQVCPCNSARVVCTLAIRCTITRRSFLYENAQHEAPDVCAVLTCVHVLLTNRAIAADVTDHAQNNCAAILVHIAAVL